MIDSSAGFVVDFFLIYCTESMIALHDFDTLQQFATEMVASETRQERSSILKRFNPDPYGAHPQSLVLQKIAQAIKANGSWEASSTLLKQLIEKDFKQGLSK